VEVVDVMEAKAKCHICKQELDLSQFSKDSRYLSGYKSLCIECENAPLKSTQKPSGKSTGRPKTKVSDANIPKHITTVQRKKDKKKEEFDIAKKEAKIETAKQLNVTLYYSPYKEQIEVHKCTSRYKAVCCGRRAGKTFLAVFEMLQKIKRHKGDNKLQIGWVAPTYQNSKRGIDTFKIIARDLISTGMCKITSTSPYTINIDGHKVYFLTAENPDAIRGYYFDYLIIDEAAFVSDDIYNNVLKPTLMDKSGDLLAISTPQGSRGFFYELYIAGKNEAITNTKSFSWPTYKNPYIKEADIEDMRNSLPSLTFRQEVLAEFIASDNQVFQTVSNCFDGKPCTCGCNTIIGCDLAKKVDYTVLVTICPECYTIKNVMRHNKVPWGEQQSKIVGEYNYRNARKIYIDATGIGDVVIDNLKDSNIIIEPIIFSNTSKNKMVSDLITYIEQGKLRWDNDLFPILAEELLCLERTVGKNTVSYNAATNGHDDVVMATALALKGAIDSIEYHIFSIGGDVKNNHNKRDIQDNITDIVDDIELNEDVWDSF